MTYPLAQYGGFDATTYGEFSASLAVACVFHTTETTSWGFGPASDFKAPHYEYKPATREWRHYGAPLDQRVGTMRSSRVTGIWANEKAIQVEIVCYSNKDVADQAANRLWVGDLTDENYRDLIDFYAWLVLQNVGVGLAVTPVPSGGWRYGTGSPHRLGVQEWYDFSGLAAHGAVPGQTHWDTGVLDLERIMNMAEEQLWPQPDSWATASWEKAKDLGIITQHSVPQANVQVQQLMVFLDRLGLLD